MGNSRFGEIITNLSEAQLYEQYLTFLRSCQCCELSHRECRVVPECSCCQTGFWILRLAEHFGVKENLK